MHIQELIENVEKGIINKRKLPCLSYALSTDEQRSHILDLLSQVEGITLSENAANKVVKHLTIYFDGEKGVFMTTYVNDASILEQKPYNWWLKVLNGKPLVIDNSESTSNSWLNKQLNSL